jgi:hypothetical protein
MWEQYGTAIQAAGLALVVALLTGRLLKKLILIPFEWWAKRTETLVDDEIVATVKSDWNVKDTTIDGKDEQ